MEWQRQSSVAGSTRTRSVLLLTIAALAFSGQPGHAQRRPDAPAPEWPDARRGAEFLIPAGSLILPGLGQYIHGAPAAGLGFTATAAAGLALSGMGEAAEDDLPRTGREQLADQASHVALTAAFLSAWDSFHRAVPSLQQHGKYEFLGPREQLKDLLTAPLDTRFLRRWTTWVDLAHTLLIAGLIVSERDAGTQYHRFQPRDAAWATSLSLNAAVGEEALFRGWLLPVLHENTGERFWVANGIQAGLFGAGHIPDAGWVAAYIGAWAAWEGWVTRRNDWSVRESIFHHFWYDVIIVAASLLVDEKQVELRIRLPAIRL